MDESYELYKYTKLLIEKADACCNVDHSDDERYVFFKSSIEYFDEANRGYAERYEKEKQNLSQIES